MTSSRILGFALVVFVGATALYALFGPPPRSEFVEGTATITGVVARPPEIRGGAQQIILKTVKGRVLVRVGRFPTYGYGDELRVKCDLKAPRRTETFDEARFLYPQKIFITCPFPDEVSKVRERPNPAIAVVFDVKERLTGRLERVLPTAEAALATGLLFGDRDLPARDQANFLATGTSHIIAVSGYNISIITGFVFSFLAVLLGRRRAIPALVSFLGAYILATGMTASVVRAAFMGIIPLLAQFLGRPVYGGNLLLLVAAVMLGFNPYLVYDLGFILSFAATAGIIFLYPALQEHFRVPLKTAAPIVRGTLGNALQTFSAILVTLPIIILAFGRLSLVAPVANLFILFAIPYAMLTGFLAGMVAVPILGHVVSFIAFVLHRYLLAVADLFARIPGASITLTNSGGATLITIVILVVLIVYAPRLIRWFRNRLRRTPPTATATTPSPRPFTLDGWRVESDKRP